MKVISNILPSDIIICKDKSIDPNNEDNFTTIVRPTTTPADHKEKNKREKPTKTRAKEAVLSINFDF
jgi:hypothetical protein